MPRSAPRLLALSGLLLAPAARGHGAERPNVIVVTLDCVRPDHLSAYGYGRRTTPTIDALAAGGVRFDNAYAQAPWTAPSLTSLLTSRYPEFHGADIRTPMLDRSLPALAGILKNHGYKTAAFVAGFPSYPAHGLLRDFDALGFGAGRFHRLPMEVLLGKGAIPWLRGRAREPFFIWIHGFNAHLPYRCPQPFRDQYDPAYDGVVHDLKINKSYELNVQLQFVEYYNNTPSSMSYVFDAQLASQVAQIRREPKDRAHFADHYDGCINYMDHELAGLAAEVRGLGLEDKTLWVVSSDHGEFLGEPIGTGAPMISHPNADMHEELLRVPLIMKGPGIPSGRVVSPPVMLIDVAPTLLSLLKVGAMPGAQGQDLSGFFDRTASSGPRGFVYASDYGHLSGYRAKALVSDGWKWTDSSSGWSLYDLRADPVERHNLIEREPERALLLTRLYLDAMARGQRETNPGGSSVSLTSGFAARGDGKELRWRIGSPLELYDLREDPGQRRNAIARRPVEGAALMRLLLRRVEERGFPLNPVKELAPASETALDGLREMGYLAR